MLENDFPQIIKIICKFKEKKSPAQWLMLLLAKYTKQSMS